MDEQSPWRKAKKRRGGNLNYARPRKFVSPTAIFRIMAVAFRRATANFSITMSRPPRKSPPPFPPPPRSRGTSCVPKPTRDNSPPSPRRPMPTRYHRDYTFARKTIDGWKFHRYSKFRPLLLRLDQLESSISRKFALYEIFRGKSTFLSLKKKIPLSRIPFLYKLSYFTYCFLRFSKKFKQ